MSDTPTPSRKQKIADRASEAIEDRQENFKKTVRAFERVAKSPDGLFVLQKIFSESQYGANGLVLDRNSDVSANILLVKQGRAGLWMDLRKYLTRESLINIEYPEERKEIKK